MGADISAIRRDLDALCMRVSVKSAVEQILGKVPMQTINLFAEIGLKSALRHRRRWRHAEGGK